MPKIAAIDPASATGHTKELLDSVQEKMGRVPNMMLTLANSPATLQSYLSCKEALSNGLLDAKLRERIAIVCAEFHEAEYCLSAHVAAAKACGLSDEELARARNQQSADLKINAALAFARNLLRYRTELPLEEIDNLRSAGYSDGEITEIIANVTMNIFGNYFSRLTQPEIDFPKVKLAFPA